MQFGYPGSHRHGDFLADVFDGVGGGAGFLVTVTGGATEVDGGAVTVVTGVDGAGIVIPGVWPGGAAVQATVGMPTPRTVRPSHRFMAPSVLVLTELARRPRRVTKKRNPSPDEGREAPTKLG